MKKYILLSVLSVISILCVALSWIAPFYLLWSIVFTFASTLSLAFFLITNFKFKKFNKLSITINVIVNLIIILFAIFYYTGLLSHFSSLEEARLWFESFGIWAWLIFFIIQIAQVIILPIPSQITTIAGVLIFGPLITFLISSIAIVTGSVLCFAIGRFFGVKIAYKIASKETVDKYRNILTKKGKILLPVMFLFPAFPDDLLCFVAGTTQISWLYFIVITFITRLIGIACICWFGSGELIPFSGWGIPVWIILVIVIVIILILLFKYQQQIEDWIISTFTKNGKLKLKRKQQKIKQKKLLDEIDENSKQNKKSYVNFENSNTTQNDYVNFENAEESNMINKYDKKDERV